MSLRPTDNNPHRSRSHSRSRSKSDSTRAPKSTASPPRHTRSRSRSAVRAPSPPTHPYPTATAPSAPYPPTSAPYPAGPPSRSLTPNPSVPPGGVPYPDDSAFYPGANGRGAVPAVQFPDAPLGFSDSGSESGGRDLAYADSGSAWRDGYPGAVGRGGRGGGGRVAFPQEPEGGVRYRTEAVGPGGSWTGKGGKGPEKYQYAPPPDRVTYTATPQGEKARDVRYTAKGWEEPRGLARRYGDEGVGPGAPGFETVKIKPGEGRRERKESSSKSKSKSSSKSKSRDAERLAVEERGGRSRGLSAPTSPGLMARDASRSRGLSMPLSPGMGPRMDRLSVSGDRPDLAALNGHGGQLPPPSPMLEAYRGTYQQVSASPLPLRPDDGSDLDDLPALSLTTPKEKKRVTVYDPSADAEALSHTLRRSRPDPSIATAILPPLSHDQMTALRKEYKKRVKVAGKGVNLAKHLKTALPGPYFAKAAYVIALGRWASEGYWANTWYQSASSRRELLIESLIGRSNAEIWNIKDEFKDKRYSDDLTKCMQRELTDDKFRAAVLTVLEERRQEERDAYPPEYARRDVAALHNALQAPRGGESAMLDIVVRRSERHLREVLRLYQDRHGESFPRAALKKSGNLVGELLAHTLNAAINRPARDALLLRHAIDDLRAPSPPATTSNAKTSDLRYELLISRVVRLHWEPVHAEKVRREYRAKYGGSLEGDVRVAGGGEGLGGLGGLLGGLCAV